VSSGKPERLYSDLMEKYEEADSMVGRLSRPPAFSVRTGDQSKARSYIQFQFNYMPDDEGVEKRSLKQMFNSLGNEPVSQVEKTFVGKSSMKVRMRVNVWLEREKRNEQGEIVKESKKDCTFITREPQRITKSTIKKVLNEQIEKLIANLENLSDKIEGSGWVIKKYLKLAIDMYEIRVARGASYLPTPEKFANAKCGLINIQNTEQKCFMWCMRYHQSKQGPTDRRASVLSNIQDKYSYENIDFPASYDDSQVRGAQQGLHLRIYH